MRILFSGVLKKFVLLCAGIFIFILFFHKGIETEDVWLHLSTGQWIINHLQLPHEDLFPFANEKTPYLCHEWMASSLIYWVFKSGGFLGLKFLRALLFMIAIGIFVVYSYRRLPFSILISLIVLMAYALFQRSLLRPDTFNLLFIQIFLISLFSYKNKGGRWKLFLLPIISVFWVNLHMMGAFIYGGSIVFIFLLTAFLNSFSPENRHAASGVLVDPKIQIKELSLTLLFLQLVFLINPYGIEGFLFPYKVLLFPHYYGFYQMITIMRELQNSLYIFFSIDYFYYILLIAFPIVLLILNKKNDLTLIFLFSLALLTFLYMTRNSSFFTLIAVYVIVQAAQNIDFTDLWRKLLRSSMIDKLLLFVVTLFFIIQSLTIFNENVYFNGQKHRALLLETNPYVKSSIKLLKNNGIAGPVFNSSLLGGSILWFDYPQLRPMDDGRHLDYQRFNDYINVLLNTKKFWHRAQKDYGIKIVILNQGNMVEQKVIKYLSSQQDWQLISVNGPFVIYVKRKEFYLFENLFTFEQQLKDDKLTQDEIQQLRSLIQRPQTSSLERFFNPTPFRVDSFSNGVTLMGLGYKGAAAKNFIEALKISDQPYMTEIVSAFLKQAISSK